MSYLSIGRGQNHRGTVLEHVFADSFSVLLTETRFLIGLFNGKTPLGILVVGPTKWILSGQPAPAGWGGKVKPCLVMAIVLAVR